MDFKDYCQLFLEWLVINDFITDEKFKDINYVKDLVNKYEKFANVYWE